VWLLSRWILCLRPSRPSFDGMGAQFSDPSPSDLSPSDLSCAFVITFLEIAQPVIARAHGEGDEGIVVVLSVRLGKMLSSQM
jgi:hypothetical protein